MTKTQRRKNKLALINDSRRYTIIANGPDLIHYYELGQSVRKEGDVFTDDAAIPLRQHLSRHHYM